MDHAIQTWLSERGVAPTLTKDVAKRLCRSYTIYGCMLLLPPTVVSDDLWGSIHPLTSDEDLSELYSLLAAKLRVTHIAVNRPIPSSIEASHSENVIRAPINFSPVYGDFGPTRCNDPPTQADFEAAFWVAAKQNGIWQSWAPRWTMFSRGNISEKARILAMPSVLEAVEQGCHSGQGSAAVDLFAGIGYFAFSYVKAGIDKVLCWDLNPWSIDGLRKGAERNKWEAKTYGKDAGTLNAMLHDNARLLVFNENNNLAVERIACIRHGLPPIRHINCGMLPSSKESLAIAAAIVDTELGGWIHVHENIAQYEINAKAEETRAHLGRLLQEHHQRNIVVSIEHINKLKSYAPRVMHCVIDLHVAPNMQS